MSSTLLVLGAGGHGRSVAEAALLGGQWNKVVFQDNAWPEVTDGLGCDVFVKIADIKKVVHCCQVATGACGMLRILGHFVALRLG